MKIEADLSAVVRGDGIETSFALDLRKHPYGLSPVSQSFDVLRGPPTGVLSPGGGPTWGLSGYVLTATFAAAPTGRVTVSAILQFDA